jgi:hypothetical protein
MIKSIVLSLAMVAMAGCATRVPVGYPAYAPAYGYPAFGPGEVVYYNQWIGETHRPYREYRMQRPADQRAYWKWRRHHYR